MKIVEAVKKIEPVDNWRYWYRKWSTWFLALIPVITFLREAVPSLVDIIPLGQYKIIMGVLGFLSIVAVQIRQRSIQVPPNPPVPEELQDDQK